MPDEATSVAVQVKLHHRVRRGVRHTHNWWQLLRFAVVGGSGYVVNLATFALCVHAFGIDYRVASVVAFLTSVTNNFWWNRHWTFDAKHEAAHFQAARFFTVSLVAFGFTYLALIGLVALGLPKLLAQAIAIVVGTPFSFIGQKLWSFRS
jgi:dolichol-phosphate mannosyltransferase